MISDRQTRGIPAELPTKSARVLNSLVMGGAFAGADFAFGSSAGECALTGILAAATAYFWASRFGGDRAMLKLDAAMVAAFVAYCALALTITGMIDGQPSISSPSLLLIFLLFLPVDAAFPFLRLSRRDVL
ncbi:hypothetical protein H8M03_12350 [Sphingomonas sabuli]|uniref:Uncharacterized protein n=1 Tax=Sphingomonas sabuli TaxID=2764186 RepID=A0A7G9L2A8_9SPHN|nr:hypothetical protein [Sphingomonas sabuli]QNM82757.1 hypothetical protein H8M03_12350 [Sphingomonas sabuli]